jgi:hypothetical protein
MTFPWLSEIDSEIKVVTFHTKCPICSKFADVSVNLSALHRYDAGDKIQHAFPNLTDDQREMLLTGYCTECWDLVVGCD